MNIGGATLESVLRRISDVAEAVHRKNALYDRAKAIDADGSVPMTRLKGTIDVLKTRLFSSVSNWYTDDQGNIVLESLDGRGAMRLCGEGFQIANGKDGDGHWDWTTFGTGAGFTADLIVAGFLSADRIEAHSITANKLAADVGQSLDLSSNVSIQLVVENQVREAIDTVTLEVIAIADTAPEAPEDGRLWLDTGGEQDVLRRWDGTAWLPVTLTPEELANIYANIERSRTEIEQTDAAIRLTVEQATRELRDALTGLEAALESSISQTAQDITFAFEQATNYTVTATGEILEYINRIQSYQRFDANGLELGVLGSPFLARLGNTKLSFVQNGAEIAYISNNRLYITEASVTNKLSIGTEESGSFEWLMTDAGLALKWRG